MGKFTTYLAVGIIGLSMTSTLALAAGTHPVTGEALADEQVFTYRLSDEPTTFDPALAEDIIAFEVMRDLFEGLMNQDKDGNLVPGVATHFDTNADKTVYTFHLRDNAKWSDGKPVTAGDFVYAWRRALDPATASPYSWFMELMQLENGAEVIAGEMPPESLGITAIDDQTLEIRLTSSLPYFPQMTITPITFPLPEWTITQYGSDWTKPGNIVGNGAYVLTEHVLQERSVRERNPLYWNNDATILDKVVGLVINDENSGLIRFQAGELNWTQIPAGQFTQLHEEYPDTAKSFPRLCSEFYSFNLSDSGPEAFKDARVRRALSLAVDRSIITDRIMQGGQTPAYTFTPEATADFVLPEGGMRAMSQAERDTLAADLMREAGFGTDNPLTFKLLYNTRDDIKKTAIAMTQMWRQKLGVQVELVNMEWKTYLNAMGEQDFELGRNSWCGDYNDASTFLDLVTTRSGYNDGRYDNPEVDALMASAGTSDNSAAIYTQVEQIIEAEAPIIPVFHFAAASMMDPDLKNWPVNNVMMTWYSKDLYIAAD
ncbi:peptide ABC transporter substrate-binding protein [Celeribacter persicus]|uniref:Oligopeptide transport system substrate-binding protein n=1 Tax=Celeribacter persicus TaxID=1651082 RepID=A0A2T5HVV0_9RHOB|nr:peptide ABC transporter substrate-binding protein [Celeribacter persicus]PTQ75719.1 oligopeptide transport system substrate-binding protein [Celeribacter persicus]